MGNVHIAVFPDFSNKVQRKRSQFQEVKCCMRAQHLKYAMLFPAKLQVKEDGDIQFFEDPAAAVAWLDQRGRPA